MRRRCRLAPRLSSDGTGAGACHLVRRGSPLGRAVGRPAIGTPPGRSDEVARRAYRPRQRWVPWSPTRAGGLEEEGAVPAEEPRAPRSRRRFTRPAPLYYFVPVPPFVHLRPRALRSLGSLGYPRPPGPRVRPRLPPTRPCPPGTADTRPAAAAARPRRVVFVVVVPAVGGSVPAVVAVVPVSAVPLEGSAATVVPVVRVPIRPVVVPVVPATVVVPVVVPVVPATVLSPRPSSPGDRRRLLR